MKPGTIVFFFFKELEKCNKSEKVRKNPICNFSQKENKYFFLWHHSSKMFIVPTQTMKPIGSKFWSVLFFSRPYPQYKFRTNRSIISWVIVCTKFFHGNFNSTVQTNNKFQGTVFLWTVTYYTLYLWDKYQLYQFINNHIL